MDGELVRLHACPSCGKSADVDAKFCSSCGKLISDMAIPVQNFSQAAKDFARDTALEVKQLSADALKSETGKKIAAGAAMGATAGLIIPLIGPAIGATVGAGIVAFSRLTK